MSNVASSLEVKLFDTLSKAPKPVRAPAPGLPLRMYVCGPTVYDHAHIGNARPVIVFDVLYRLLRHVHGTGNVVYARNITDVDDKINARAARDFPGLPLNEAIARVTAQTEAQFHRDVAELGCLPPDEEPHATAHIDGMKALIERLVARGFAYVAQDHVLFSVAAMQERRGLKLPAYGALARRSLDEMLAGARVDIAPYKRDAMDFVLWKPSKEGEPGWISPAGIAPLGRPGWHIECSAMSMATLLAPFGGGLDCDDPTRNTFDIHGGGIDLVFPHHENEIAQSCCALDTPAMADIWMHNGFLMVEGEKMSKSLGNFITIHELLRTDRFGGRSWPGDVLRLAMLKTHYRKPIDWTVKALEEAEATLMRFSAIGEMAGVMLEDRTVFHDPPLPPIGPSEGLLEALCDDLNMPQALAHLYRLLDEARDGSSNASRTDAMVLLVQDTQFLGIDIVGFRSRKADADAARMITSGLERRKIDDLVAERVAARKAKDFRRSDELRAELDAMGIAVMDGKDAAGELVTTWELKS
jgi:cysteinyl-tRNA synthetase